MAQGRGVWLGVLFACLTWVSHASEPSAMSVLVSGPDNDYTVNFQKALEARIGPAVVLTADVDSATLVLALGEGAFRQALALQLPVIGVHISSHTLQAVRQSGCRCTAVYSEVTTAAQLLVLREMLPGARRVGVLLGPHSSAADLPFDLPGLLFEQRTLSRAEQLPAALAELLPRVDVLLALPDPVLYNAETARLVLLSSYRQAKPVIGPDEQFVRAGSLAAAYPSAEGLIEATLLMLSHEGLPATLPEPVYARATVALNVHVARSYGVIAPDIPAIERRLEAQ